MYNKAAQHLLYKFHICNNPKTEPLVQNLPLWAVAVCTSMCHPAAHAAIWASFMSGLVINLPYLAEWMDKLVLSPLRLGPFCTVITRLNAFCQLSLPGLSPLEVNIGSKKRELHRTLWLSVGLLLTGRSNQTPNSPTLLLKVLTERHLKMIREPTEKENKDDER